MFNLCHRYSYFSSCQYIFLRCPPTVGQFCMRVAVVKLRRKSLYPIEIITTSEVQCNVTKRIMHATKCDSFGFIPISPAIDCKARELYGYFFLCVYPLSVLFRQRTYPSFTVYIHQRALNKNF